MGTLLTVIIGGAVIAYAGKVIVGVAKKTRAGECSGCGDCPASGNCESRK